MHPAELRFRVGRDRRRAAAKSSNLWGRHFFRARASSRIREDRESGNLFADPKKRNARVEPWAELAVRPSVVIVPGDGPSGGVAGLLGQAMLGPSLKKARWRRIVASSPGPTAMAIAPVGGVGRRKSAGDAS